jgi:hypothetical protein
MLNKEKKIDVKENHDVKKIGEMKNPSFSFFSSLFCLLFFFVFDFSIGSIKELILL